MSLDLLQVVLVQTRFPENIGMAARACVNMGSHSIRLVAPERWDREKARPLATPKGQGVLDDVQVLPDVSAAVADCSLVIGTTARTGGWRRSLLSPEQAAGEVAQALERGEKVAIVFGPEDRGLDNDAIQHCQRLVTIPTNPEASSLNLAQSVLLLLYECAKAVRARQHEAAGEKAPAEGGSGRVISSADYERLLDKKPLSSNVSAETLSISDEAYFDLQAELGKDVFTLSEDEYYCEYWLWFMRHIVKKGGAEDGESAK